MVETEVPHTRIDLAEAREREHGTDSCAGDYVVPVVELIDCQGSSDQHSAENRGVDEGLFPHCAVEVGEDL